jgi:hypothetical protein
LSQLASGRRGGCTPSGSGSGTASDASLACVTTASRALTTGGAAAPGSGDSQAPLLLRCGPALRIALHASGPRLLLQVPPKGRWGAAWLLLGAAVWLLLLKGERRAADVAAWGAHRLEKGVHRAAIRLLERVVTVQELRWAGDRAQQRTARRS